MELAAVITSVHSVAGGEEQYEGSGSENLNCAGFCWHHDA